MTYGPDFCYFPLYLPLFFPCTYIAASREVSVPPANSILLVKTALQTSDAAGVEMIMILGLEGNLQRLFIHIQGKLAVLLQKERQSHKNVFPFFFLGVSVGISTLLTMDYVPLYFQQMEGRNLTTLCDYITVRNYLCICCSFAWVKMQFAFSPQNAAVSARLISAKVMSGHCEDFKRLLFALFEKAVFGA